MLKKFIILAVMAVALVGSVTGCNTMRGAGEDVESVGETIQDRT